MLICAVYIGIAVGYGILFLLSRGFFERSAGYLIERIEVLGTCTTVPALSHALLIFFGATILSAVMTAGNVMGDTARKGYLVREEYGGTDEEEQLVLTYGDEEQEITVPVEARHLSEKEVKNHLAEAAEALETAVFHGEVRKDHVDRDLILPDTVGDHPVRISWMTDQPEVLDFEGRNLRLTSGAGGGDPGIPVTLTAEITCEEEYLEKTFLITVYPKKMSDEERYVLSAENRIREENSESDLQINLPGQIDGVSAAWRKKDGGSGWVLLFLGGLAAVLYVYAVLNRERTKEAERIEQMKRDYPGLISKLVLLVSAGMSLRSAFFRISRDYRASLAQGGEAHPGYEEIVAVTREIEHGVPEAEAYANMGKRVQCPVYKTFGTLLVQNLMRGGNDMAALLMREADEAFDERKKRARVLGEEAGTKLLLPMMLMLCVVMAILIVPAFFAFQ